MTDNYNGQLCKTFHPRKHEALRKHSLRLSAGACAARSPVPQLLWISPATKTGCRALWHGQDSAQQGRASPWSTYTASQAGFTARNMLRAAGAELYSPIQAGYLKTEQRHTRLLGVARSTSQDEPQTHFSGWSKQIFPTGSRTAQANNLGLLKKLKAMLIVSSKALEEVIPRRNHFHCNCTFNLSLGSYAIPTWRRYSRIITIYNND